MNKNAVREGRVRDPVPVRARSGQTKFASRARRSRQAAIECGQWQVHGFGDSYIPGVVARQILSQLPDAVFKGTNRHQLDLEFVEIPLRRCCLQLADLFGEFEPPQDVQALHNRQVRRYQETPSDHLL